jgi:hypothetical protein
LKRTAGKSDPFAEAYAIVTNGRFTTDTARAAFESIACFKREIAARPDVNEERFASHRAETFSRFCRTNRDADYAAIHRGKVTEAHHAAEEMRLPKTSARDDGGKVPSAMTCSARLP